MMHTLVAAAHAVGDVIYARGHEREISAISYSDPEAGKMTVTFCDGVKLPVSAAAKVTVIRLTSK